MSLWRLADDNDNVGKFDGNVGGGLLSNRDHENLTRREIVWLIQQL